MIYYSVLYSTIAQIRADKVPILKLIHLGYDGNERVGCLVVVSFESSLKGGYRALYRRLL